MTVTMCQSKRQRRHLPYPDAKDARKLAAKSATLSSQLERKRKEKADQGNSSLRVPGRWVMGWNKCGLACQRRQHVGCRLS